jgi:hypothetical protein
LDIKQLFRDRLRDLKKLGFPDYATYLQSPLWKSIRQKVFTRDQHWCRVCENKAEQVHHTRYDLATLRGIDLSQLFSVCRDCHKTIEFDGDVKRQFWEVINITRAMLLQLPIKTVPTSDRATSREDAILRESAIENQIRRRDNKPRILQISPPRTSRVNTSRDPVLLKLRSTPTGKTKKRKT